MSEKVRKQFGVWMDSHHATIAGRQGTEKGEFIILGHVNNDGPDKNSNESSTNHQEITLTHKFFKQIASKLVNMEQVHVTGTGQIQEQFMKYLADTAQYKKVAVSESTSNKMSDEKLLTFFSKYFN